MVRFHRVRYYVFLAAGVACLTSASSSTSAAPGRLWEFSEDMATVAEKVGPSVVALSVEGRDSDTYRDRRDSDQPRSREFFREWRWRGELPFGFFRDRDGGRFELPFRRRNVNGATVGTGILMDGEGHIVTASHLVDDPRDRIEVRLADGRQFEAEFVGSDQDSGVAVVKIDAEDLTPAVPGNSDNVRVGELVLAFSNLRQSGATVTAGIVSATGRSGLGITTYDDLIQTDAKIGPGSGGGPLVNARGDVIGMIIAGDTEGTDAVNEGFAVPLNTVLKVQEDLVADGTVTRGWLGVHIQEVHAELADRLGLEFPRGALVAGVGPGTPAEVGGVQQGDVIIELDGKTIENVAHLRKTVAATDPGTEIAVIVMRNGEQVNLTVRVGERTEDSIATMRKSGSPLDEAEWMGLTAQELTEDLADKMGYEGEEGVLVSDVRRDSPAHKKGLQRGDLIQEVEHRSISNMEDYEEAIASAGDSPLLRIKRRERVWYEVIKAESD